MSIAIKTHNEKFKFLRINFVLAGFTLKSGRTYRLMNMQFFLVNPNFKKRLKFHFVILVTTKQKVIHSIFGCLQKENKIKKKEENKETQLHIVH